MRLSSALLATVVASLSASASADQISATITPTRNLTHVIFAFAYDSSTIFGPGAVSCNYFPEADIPAGGPVNITETYTNFFSIPIIGYTVFAEYNDSLGSGATIGFKKSVGDDLILNSDPWPFDTYSPAFGTQSEDVFVHALETNNADQWDRALKRMIYYGQAPALGEDSTLVNFSNATNGGTVTNVQSVPEPASLLALTIGVAALIRRRQR